MTIAEFIKWFFSDHTWFLDLFGFSFVAIMLSLAVIVIYTTIVWYGIPGYSQRDHEKGLAKGPSMIRHILGIAFLLLCAVGYISLDYCI